MHSRWIITAWLLAALAGLPRPASAATTLRSFSNYFGFIEQVDETSLRVFAGRTFNQQNVCNSVSPTETCNSCALLGNIPITGSGGLANGLACNDREVHPSLQFSVTLSSDQAAVYSNCTNIIMARLDSTTIEPSGHSTFTQNTAGQEVTAYWDLARFCEKASGGTSQCLSSFRMNLQIGFRSNCGSEFVSGETPIKVELSYRYIGNSPKMTFGCDEATLGAFEGFCNFAVYPGDEKVHLSETGVNNANSYAVGDQTAATTPSLAGTRDSSNMIYRAVRIFYEPGTDFTPLTPASPSQEITVVEGVPQDSRVTGLENGVQYVFAMANVDQAGNVEFFSDSQGTTMSASVDPAEFGQTQSAIPEPVYGLLDDKSCFIATAAFGSADAGDVRVLREFRNRFLLTNRPGKAFVDLYYRISPPIAEFIADREWLKAIVRNSLSPFVLIAQAALGLGFLGLVVMGLGVLVTFVASIRSLRKGTRR